MYVQTTTAGIENFHRATPFHRAASDASKSENLLRVLSATSRRLQFVELPSVPVILVSGLCERQSETTSVADAAAQTVRHLGAHFHPSLWLSESHDLLVTQGDYRVDTHGPTGRDVARD